MENENKSVPLLEASCTGKRFSRGHVVPYSIFVTFRAVSGEAALYIMLEHNGEAIGPLMDQLAAENIIPEGLILFVNPGILPATIEGGVDRPMRTAEFDQFGREFSDFLVEELIPQAEALAGIKVSPCPDMHMIAGGSSGGMCAWNAVWFRNDYFRRAFLSSPTFSAMRGGEEAMVLARKCETRPIRIYMSTGTVEPDYFFGSSFYAACNAKRVFEYAQYDFRFELFPGEGHCCHREDPAFLRRVFTFLWHHWQKEPVQPLGNQIRIQHLLAPGSVWEKVQDAGIPDIRLSVRTPCATFTAGNGTIEAERNGKVRTVADDLENISAMAVSTDGWLLYVADLNRRFIYRYTIQPDGALADFGELAPFHLKHDCRETGCRDFCVTASNRLLAATELGVQGIVSGGLTDLILPLPDDLPATRVWLENDLLYAASGNRVFRRPLRPEPNPDSERLGPQSPGYGDGFSYSLPHLPQ